MINKINNFLDVKFGLILECGEKVGVNKKRLQDAIKGMRDRIELNDYSRATSWEIEQTLFILEKNLEKLKTNVLIKDMEFCINCILARDVMKGKCDACLYPSKLRCRAEKNPYDKMRKTINAHEMTWLMTHMDSKYLYEKLKDSLRGER